jgi:hypothetical protein
MKTNDGGKNVNDKLLDEYGYEVAERAAILEFEAGMTREEAEWMAVIGSDLTEGNEGNGGEV